MLAEWSVECAADDPMLVVPWSDPSSDLHFVDLRENPYDLDQILEAEQYPPLMQALRALNASRSPVFTAKCDAWPFDDAELDDLRQSLALGAMEADTLPIIGDDLRNGFGSYIDLLWRERAIFTSFHQTEQLLHRLTRRASQFDYPVAMLDCVLRPAMLDLTGPQEGFAISLYIKALGPDQETASANWAAALEDVVGLLRSKDFAPA